MIEALPVTSNTTEVVMAKMNVALTKATLGIQTLNDMEGNLIYNEDNLTAIATFLQKAREAKKIIEVEHKKIKEPYLREGQIIDESKRNMLEQVDGVMKIANDKYTNLCREIEDKRKKEEQESQRKQAIQSGIDTNMISFSGKIAECKTDEQLLDIERKINLEKGKRDKYQEFFDMAVEKYTSLTVLLKTQKESVREFNKLEEEKKKAEEAGNDAKLIEIFEQQQNLESKIDENKVTVQETAINQSVIINPVTEIRTSYPSVKTRRVSWDWEVVNILEATKKMPSWTKIEPVTEKIDEFLKASKEQWSADGKEEVVMNGIKFFLKKTY